MVERGARGPTRSDAVGEPRDLLGPRGRTPGASRARQQLRGEHLPEGVHFQEPRQEPVRSSRRW